MEMSQMTDASTRTYAVLGMTCEHCRSSVVAEVSKTEGVEGVEGVEVDLATGTLEVRGLGASDDAVAAAVAEAGYRVAEVA